MAATSMAIPIQDYDQMVEKSKQDGEVIRKLQKELFEYKDLNTELSGKNSVLEIKCKYLEGQVIDLRSIINGINPAVGC